MKGISRTGWLWFCLLVCFSLSGWGGIVWANPAVGMEDTAAYATLLKKYTHPGKKQGVKTVLVDYDHWGHDPLHQKALSALQRVPVSRLSPQEKMAYWINAYNLLTIDLIIRTGEMSSIKRQGSMLRSVWKSHFWRIQGQRYSLDQIEHRILRPMGDPRVHMAINCASISCPDLRSEPYLASRLQTQLSDQARRFLINEKKGVRLLPGGAIQVSRIFEWFRSDFEKTGGVLRFIQQYRPIGVPAPQISGYLVYNWSLNRLSAAPLSRVNPKRH